VYITFVFVYYISIPGVPVYYICDLGIEF